MNGSLLVGEYWYDGDGKRVKKKEYDEYGTAKETTIFIYDASGKIVAEYSTNPAQTEAARVSYLTQDHLGSPRITTDKDGKVFSRRDFMPFGEEIKSEHTSQRDVNLNYGEDGIKQKFTTYERDFESELDFAQARYYSRNHGRFYSVDPENYGAREDDPQSWNGYGYGRNNPILYTDSDGLEYKICNTKGECVTQDDSVVLKAQKKLRGSFVETGRNGHFDSGDILDNDGNILGTYERTSIDPEYQFVYGISEQSSRKAKVVGGLAVGAVVVGACIGTGTCAAVGAVASRYFTRSALQVASSAAFYAARNLDKFTVSSKHLLGSAGRWAKFTTNSQKAIRQIVKEALTSPNAVFKPNGNSPNSYIIITDLGRAIGTKGETAVKVVFDKTGKIWSAYPIKK